MIFFHTTKAVLRTEVVIFGTNNRLNQLNKNPAITSYTLYYHIFEIKRVKHTKYLGLVSYTIQSSDFTTEQFRNNLDNIGDRCLNKLRSGVSNICSG